MVCRGGAWNDSFRGRAAAAAVAALLIMMQGVDVSSRMNTYRSGRAVDGGAESGSRAVEQVSHDEDGEPNR